MSDYETDLLKKFSDKINAKKKQKDIFEYLYLMVESMILVGPNIVAKSQNCDIYVIKDNEDLKVKLNFILFNTQKIADDDEDNPIDYGDSCDPFVRNFVYFI